MNQLKIATRESALALWQANHVKALLEAAHPGLACELMPMTTEGDRNKVSPLRQMGGKGVFVKELELALMDGSADIAVHSMKDLPGELPDGLTIGAMVERADPRDALVSNRYPTLDDLPAGARIGSSSLRRVLQLRRAYPALRFDELRGNVDTRLRKLDEDNYDAIILAVAGLDRLGLSARVAQKVATDLCIPAAGQGAIGVECRASDGTVSELIKAINHADTAICVAAERSVTAMLGATCNLPVAVFGERLGDEMLLRSFIADPVGERVIHEQAAGDFAKAALIAANLGAALLAAGAQDLIDTHD